MNASTPPDWLAANRANWDAWVPLHVASDFYDLEGFKAGEDALRDFERAEVGDVTGRSLLHLQCHIGLDTLSWARHGAERVVGLDFSGPAVEAARRIASDIGLSEERARFVRADVYDAARAVPGEAFDIVYTGVGALCWLPDLRRWAEVAASLVAPGGFLYLAEFHPFTDILDDETGSRVTRDYFGREAHVYEATGSYVDPHTRTGNHRVVEWRHPIGDVVSALAEAGLRLEFLHEHDVSLFPRFGSFHRGEDGYYRFPEGAPGIPLMYSLRASRPRV
ncbi:bifunctional 2-polyprenyl-6-hydroxyphenol methylase/3-demethylubiquinol 3-O-methyltransferase UbiG [Nocardiopsis sp. MG754419]|uniref:class I SAM-dependent methyltransferase n=1 Tax=Nocardiopsis sp. MG754419 TaxID=2259865 RepID=UPI001BAAA7E3|nr:methyltransferase domain-containing protein [Nocardiopsis sp. MG754419]MBR8744052.1 SAM-dependent methyltransferase [Nocardiopsis sp. MG754419]